MSNLSIPYFEFADVNKLNGFQHKFAKDGFIILKDFLDTNLINELADWTKSFIYGSSKNLKVDVTGKQNRIQDAALFEELVRELACHEKIINLLEEIYGRKPIPFQTLNFLRGTEQQTHSDSIHFNSIPQRWMCGVWVAFEDVGKENGPLHYYPGSHRLPILDASDTNSILLKKRGFYSAYSSHYEPAIQELINIAGLKKEVFFPRKGDCLIWSSNLLHGGEAILDNSLTRLSQVTHYFFENCTYTCPLHSNPKKSKIIYKDPIHNFLEINSNNKNLLLSSKRKYLIKHFLKKRLNQIKKKFGIQY